MISSPARRDTGDGTRAQLVRRKLATITCHLDLLAVVEPLTLDQYRADAFRQKGTERLL